MCPFNVDYTAFMVREKGCDPVHQFNHTSWVAVVIPSDRSKSVHNRCVICDGGVVVLSISKKKML